MTNFFEKSDLSKNDAERIISETLKQCDDGELYLENSKSESILLDDNKIKDSSYNSDLGFGFRAISGEVVAYSHSNEISQNSIKQSAESLKSTLKSIKGDIDWKDFLSEYDFRIKGKKRMDSILIGRCILNCDTKLQKEILNIIERSRFLESAQKKINKLK